MNQKVIQQELEKIESSEKAVILYQFLRNQRENKEELSEMLLDLIHTAFTSGFEVAIDSVISSFNKNTIE